jgi:hypothetical protein
VITRTRSFALVLALGVLIALAMATLAQTAPAASSYKTCTLSERDQDPPGEKPTYNLSLKRIGTTCGTAKKVMYAFHKCRSRTAFRCTKKIESNWTCAGTKDDSAMGIFYATFTCKYGSRRVKSTYQQTL